MMLSLGTCKHKHKKKYNFEGAKPSRMMGVITAGNYNLWKTHPGFFDMRHLWKKKQKKKTLVVLWSSEYLMRVIELNISRQKISQNKEIFGLSGAAGSFFHIGDIIRHHSVFEYEWMIPDQNLKAFFRAK